MLTDRSYWRLVGMVFGWQLAASICYYTIFAGTPLLRDVFVLTRFEVGIVVTALSLGYAIFVVPLGIVTDRYGERRLLTLGLLGLATTLLLVVRSLNYAMLLGAVFLLGGLYGTATPGTNKAIFDNIAPARQHLAIGLKQVGVTAGSGVSALLVTGLAGVFFWEAGFVSAAGFGFVVAVAFYVFYANGGGGDVAGLPDFAALLANRSYLLLVSAGFFLGSAFFTTTGYTVLYVQESIETSVTFGGIVLALVMLFGSFGRILTGWLSDVLPGQPQTRIGAILVVQALASSIMFVVVAWTETPLGAAIAFSVLGFFVLGSTGVYYSMMGTLVAPDKVGGASSGGQLALTSGSLLAPPAFGLLADLQGYRWSWLFLAALTAVAALLLVVTARSSPPVANTAVSE